LIARLVTGFKARTGGHFTPSRGRLKQDETSLLILLTSLKDAVIFRFRHRPREILRFRKTRPAAIYWWASGDLVLCAGYGLIRLGGRHP
jgi:hypothetical protein